MDISGGFTTAKFNLFLEGSKWDLTFEALCYLLQSPMFSIKKLKFLGTIGLFLLLYFKKHMITLTFKSWRQGGQSHIKTWLLRWGIQFWRNREIWAFWVLSLHVVWLLMPMCPALQAKDQCHEWEPCCLPSVDSLSLQTVFFPPGL